MKKILDFVKRNWYAIVVTIGSFLVGVEVLWSGAGFVVPFLCGFGYLIYIMTRKPKKDE